MRGPRLRHAFYDAHVMGILQWPRLAPCKRTPSRLECWVRSPVRLEEHGRLATAALVPTGDCLEERH